MKILCCMIVALMLQGCFSSHYYDKEPDEEGYSTEVIEKDGHTFLWLTKIDDNHHDWILRHNPRCTAHDWQEEVKRFVGGGNEN